MKMPTLNEIADAAGVSITVVSRVLSPNRELNLRVASKTREHVLEVAGRMGYKPNRNAEFLKRGQNPVIGVFLPRYDDSLIARLTFGISDEAIAQNFPVSFHYDMSLDSYKSFIDTARNMKNCGIITFPYFEADTKCEKLIEKYVNDNGKIVMISQSRHLPQVTTVRIDDYYGGRLAAECLLEHGCTQVFAYISIGNRGVGCAETLRNHNVDCQIYAVEKFAVELVHNKVLDSVKQGKATGFFAGTDHDALAFYKFAGKNKLEIGKDVFVVGYDNQNYSELISPALTTVDQPLFEVGKTSVVKLIDLIYNKETSSEVVKPTLIKRDSA